MTTAYPQRHAGFTLLEIMIVVTIIGVLAIIALPAFLRARQATQTSACLDKLRQLDAAKEQFAIENNKAVGDSVTSTDLDPYLKRGVAGLVEPTGGTYDYGVIGTDPTCSNYESASHPATL